MSLSLIIEDGTHVANANSYVAVSDVNNYAAIMGLVDTWGAPLSNDATAIQAIIIACRSLEANFGTRYMSSIIPPGAQSLLWPRMIFWDNAATLVPQNTIPQPLKDAQCQLAIDYLANNADQNYLFPTVNLDSHIQQRDEKIGDISVSKHYWEAPRIPNFVVVEKILWRIIDGDKAAVQVML